MRHANPAVRRGRSAALDLVMTSRSGKRSGIRRTFHRRTRCATRFAREPDGPASHRSGSGYGSPIQPEFGHLTSLAGFSTS